MQITIKFQINTSRSVPLHIKDEIKELLIDELTEMEDEHGILRAAIEEELDDIEITGFIIGAE